MTVIVYTKPNCPGCTATKSVLTAMNIRFEMRPIDDVALALAAEKGYTAAPIVVSGKLSWSGFDPEKLNDLSKPPRLYSSGRPMLRLVG